MKQHKASIDLTDLRCLMQLATAQVQNIQYQQELLRKQGEQVGPTTFTDYLEVINRTECAIMAAQSDSND